ncbi:winged helix-turn-helix domain-containing protein [Rhizobium paknamense]|uniref:Molybdate transport system regulatory protein n=1 Tax=Rhizobium paknamense TaxID=1206817 RepID=A0ABU0I9Y2_9HYPH|nr:transcriptional regulator [Rhizobium paknamense]MDQ0455040.1 molybdate transport system regulatory protein [Rhizobium paknamense]
MSEPPKLTFRIDFANGMRLGPGKVALLGLISEKGSIRSAGEALGMSYRRAWLLADEINTMFAEVSIITRHGGKQGGGAELTAFGQALLARSLAMEVRARAAMAEDLAWLAAQTSRPG